MKPAFMSQVREVRYECGLRTGEVYTGLNMRERLALKDGLRGLSPLAAQWSRANMNARLASGKPVYMFGRSIARLG